MQERDKFCYQHNLHSSQTQYEKLHQEFGFATSIIYIVLKPSSIWNPYCFSFATSIIYIVLKPQMLSTCKYPT